MKYMRTSQLYSYIIIRYIVYLELITILSYQSAVGITLQLLWYYFGITVYYTICNYLNKCYYFVAILLLLCCYFVVAVYYTICNYLNKCYNFFIYFLLINQSVNLPYKKFIYALASNASKVLGLIVCLFFSCFICYLIYTMIYF